MEQKNINGVTYNVVDCSMERVDEYIKKMKQ